MKKTIQLFVSDKANKVVILLCYDNKPVGLLAAATTPNLLCPDMRVASEAIFYVTPEHRGRYSFKLVEAFEHWAKIIKANIILMANFGNETLDRLYHKKGYKLVEHSFIKELQQ